MDESDVRYAPAKALWDAFRAVATIADSALVGPNAWVVNASGNRKAIVIGEHTVVRGIIRVDNKGSVSIADRCYVGDDTILSSHASIEVKSDVLIAHGCQIFDNVSHPLDAEQRAAHYRAIVEGQPSEHRVPAAPILIEQSAWLGFNSVVMKGVHIGPRSIVSVGSVVMNDVPADAIVVGNPATRRETSSVTDL
jgi:acetyltransferase-like isoleucine patch superfamily enzyme